ncbi:MAG: rubrerythrin family protein [Planctomycetes bacterium]|nr:rubrerythrin family protein [Planctomycetota bacterium]
MRKPGLIICLVSCVLASSGVYGGEALSKYPETVAVLQLLYADESKAMQSYWACAEQAHKEKQFNIESFYASLAISKSIRVEAIGVMLMDMEIAPVEPAESDIRVSSTKFNLKLLTNIQLPKLEKRYPILLEHIKPEGHAVAIQNISLAWKVDVQHRELAEEILSSLESFFGIGAKIPDAFYVCQGCGSTVVDVPDLTCPICEGPISDYVQADAKWRFNRAIEGNELLSDQEKAFAVRMYDYIYAAEHDQEEIELGAEAFKGQLYVRWGLGSPREFCLCEKIYVAGLEKMSQMWAGYNSIDADDLDEADKTFLKEMHDKYGDGPINLRREKGKVPAEVLKLLDMVEIVSGRTEFEDQDLIFLRALIGS